MFGHLIKSNYPKIKIIAVAKNEALFLPAWVFHHFYYGVDAIDLYVNRTEDNSSRVLDILCTEYKELSVYNADAYDMVIKHNVSLQTLVYANSYYNNRGFDYLFFIDLDEYYFPANGKDKIGKMLQNLDYPDHLLLEWFCINGNEEWVFPLATAVPHKGHISALGKSILKIGLNIRAFFPHMPVFESEPRSCLADGSVIENDPKMGRQFLNQALQKGFKDYFLVHDWMRSPVHYLASLQNGSAARDIIQDDFKKLKYNRPVYNLNVGSNICSRALLAEEEYLTRLKKLYANRALNEELHKASIFKYQQALRALEILITHGDEQITKNAVAAFGPLEGLRVQILGGLKRLQAKDGKTFRI